MSKHDFQPVIGRAFVVVCKGCDRRLDMEKEPVFADLKGEAFKAYYCAACRLHDLETVCGRDKAAARSRMNIHIDGCFGDEEWRDRTESLVKRRGNFYTLSELEDLVCLFDITSHQECILENPDDFSGLELHQAKETQRRFDRIHDRYRAYITRAKELTA